MSGSPALYAVIGRSEDQPLLYHMNQPREHAETLRERREPLIGQPCYIVPMVESSAGPQTALQRAEAERFGTIDP